MTASSGRRTAFGTRPNSRPTMKLPRIEPAAITSTNRRGSYWVPGWWEEVWVACLQGLYDSRRGRREPATRREDPPIWRYRIWSTLGTDRRRQVLRPGAAASLAGGRPLPRMRQRYRGPRRLRRYPTAPAALPVQGMRGTLRRPHRHGAGRASPAAAGLGAVPVLHGPEPLQPADRPGAGPRRLRCAGHDGAAAPRLGCQDRARAAGRRGGDRRGLRRGRAQGPTRGGGQRGGLDGAAGWRERRAAARWRRTSRRSWA